MPIEGNSRIRILSETEYHALTHRVMGVVGKWQRDREYLIRGPKNRSGSLVLRGQEMHGCLTFPRSFLRVSDVPVFAHNATILYNWCSSQSAAPGAMPWTFL
jgi:hypothetical protein